MSEIKEREFPASIGEQPASDIDFAWSRQNTANYLGPRIVASTATGAVIGASGGYYAGTGAFFPFYTYALTGGLISASFFGGNLLLRNIRQKDDWTNFAVSGSMNGGLVGLIRSRRNGIIGVVVGGVGGVLYKLTSDAVYDSGREAWIASRRYSIETSKPRVLTIRRPPVDPRHVGDVPKDRKFEGSPAPTDKPKP